MKSRTSPASAKTEALPASAAERAECSAHATIQLTHLLNWAAESGKAETPSRDNRRPGETRIALLRIRPTRWAIIRAADLNSAQWSIRLRSVRILLGVKIHAAIVFLAGEIDSTRSICAIAEIVVIVLPAAFYFRHPPELLHQATAFGAGGGWLAGLRYGRFGHYARRPLRPRLAPIFSTCSWSVRWSPGSATASPMPMPDRHTKRNILKVCVPFIPSMRNIPTCHPDITPLLMNQILSPAGLSFCPPSLPDLSSSG